MSDYFDRVEQQIVRNVEAGLPRPSRHPNAFGYLATAAAVAVVVVVAGAFLLTRGSGQSPEPTSTAGHAVMVFTASGIDPHAPLGPAVDRAAVILRERLRTVFPAASVSNLGDNVIVVVPNAPAGARNRVLALAVRGELAFYDWEADAITPNGKTVASQLRAQDPSALEISQGSGSAAPGQPGAGAVSRGRAFALASKIPGSVVLRATAPSALGQGGRFYVLRNVPALSGLEITHPEQGRDRGAGTADVSFGFTAAGATAFRDLTKSVAERGDLLSGVGQTLDQHFAVALDDQLLTVPYISFQQYPDGISGDQGADISAGFTVGAARNLATILRYGPLPVRLTATG